MRNELKGKRKGVVLYWKDGIFAVSLVAMICMCLYLARYGFCSFDEAFYLTVPQRIANGERLLLNEWHGSQFSALLLYPVYKLYFALGGALEGIVLNFRYIYVIFQALLAIFAFIRLRKQFAWGAVVCSLLLFSYAPFNIRALSYNSMGIGLFALCAIVLITVQANRKLDCVLTGFFFGCSVLCCPYLVLVFFPYFLYRCFGKCLERKGYSVLFSWKGLLFFCIGAGIVAVYLFVFLWIQGVFPDCISMVPYILDDPEHSGVSIGQKLFDYGYSVFSMNIGSILAACTGCVFVLLRIARKTVDRRVKFIIGCAITLVWLLISAVQNRHWNYIMLPLTFLSVVAFVNTERKNWRVFWLAFVPAIGYTICINLSSNLGIMAISSVSCISSAIGLLFIEDFVREISCAAERKQWSTVLLGRIAVCLVVAVQFVSMYALKFIDYPLDMKEYKEKQIETIDAGVCKGLITTAQNASVYRKTIQDTEELRKTGEKVLYYTPKCWMYLADNKPYASYSAWISINYFDDINERICERIRTYWKLNPEAKPKYIWIDGSVRQEPYSVLNWLGVEEYSVEEKQMGFLVSVFG